ncbi:MAG: hypothetical protein GX916_10175 [Clostridiales bacterium]|jgi:hypothetical protein|nr:hypothetical protein [Clostridiales bacterium]
MKRIIVLLATIALITTTAIAGSTPDIGSLSLPELEALRRQVDERILQLRLPDADGFISVADGETYAREPDVHLGEQVRLEGEVLQVAESSQGFDYILSLDGRPDRLFLITYAMPTGQPLLLAGDLATAFGTFEGLAPFDSGESLMSGLPRVTASLVIQRPPAPTPLAAPPHAGTQQDPAPLYVTAVYEGTYWTNYASFEFQMTDSARGKSALKTAKAFSNYNITPLKTQEYYMVWLTVKALSAPNGRADISEEDFYFVSASGAEYRHHFLINSNMALRNLYEGGEQEVLLSCLIDKDDTPLLVYQPQSTNPLWFDPN